MPSVVFADIDGTLIETHRSGSAVADDSVGARDSEGRVIAVRAPRHHALMALLASADAVVPVTGRSVAAFSRVSLMFRSWAIAHHGAVVLLPNGEPDRDFDAVIGSLLDEAHSALQSVYAETVAHIARSSADLRVYRQQIAGRTAEVCVKSVTPAATAIAAVADPIEAWWRELPGVRVHRNGNNLAILPAAVTKERAVAWVLARLESELGRCVRFGVGDSLTDLGYMRTCDYFIIPRGSQIDVRVFGEGE